MRALLRDTHQFLHELSDGLEVEGYLLPRQYLVLHLKGSERCVVGH